MPSPAVSIRHHEGRVRLEVTEAQAHGLRLESDQGRRLRLALDGAPRAWGRWLPAYAGIAWARVDGAASPEIIAPIRAADARKTETPEAWMKTFASALARSKRSPLRPGTWELAALSPRPPTAWEAERGVIPDDQVSSDETPYQARDLLLAVDRPSALVLRWGTFGAGCVLPLRDPSLHDAARVKAFRKLAREGALPPVLLWWVAPLDGYLVLDGHDRLLAAKLEGMRARAVALYGVRDEPPEPAWGVLAAEGHARAFANETRLSARTRDQQNERLLRAFRVHRRTSTPAVARRDLGARFTEELASFERSPAIEALLAE